MDILLKLSEICSIISDRSAEKNVTALSEILINGRTGSLNGSFLDCKSQCLFTFVKGQKLIVRVVLPDRLGDRTTDQAEADET